MGRNFCIVYGNPFQSQCADNDAGMRIIGPFSSRENAEEYIGTDPDFRDRSGAISLLTVVVELDNPAMYDEQLSF